jgi:hypothetical protein
MKACLNTISVCMITLALPVVSFAQAKAVTVKSFDIQTIRQSQSALSFEQSKLINLNKLISAQKTLAASSGGSNGGGGTSVKSQKSKALILWDLFANDPLYTEEEAGDQLALPLTSYIERIKYADFKSFDILKLKLNQLQNKHPNLYKIINNRDNFLQNEKAIALFATEKYVKNLEELFFKYDYSSDEYVASPLAHFDDKTSFVYVTVNLWNQLGIKSQAAFLLHERLRGLQLKYPELSNELIQGIVSFVMDPEMALMMGVTPNDKFFDLKEAKNEMQLNHNQADPLRRLRELTALGLFTEKEMPVKNPKTIGSRNLKATGTNEEVLTANSCLKLVSGFESVTNTYRPKLGCSAEGFLGGTGELYFATPLKSEIVTIDVVASLYNPYDGGSEIELNIFNGNDLSPGSGARAKIANHGYIDVSLNLKNVKPSLKDLWSLQLMAKYNVYRFVLDRKNRVFSVFMMTEGKILSLASADISDKLNLAENKLSWSFSINNNSVVQKIIIRQ